jgi:TolA-binding protein
MLGKWTIRRIFAPVLLGLAALVAASSLVAAPGDFDTPSAALVGKLREAERYQFNIAEKYYREQNWKVAQAEYEKFLALYEKSEGAPYVQLKWSLCLVKLRKLNTAIKDGFQSVIDYWPESSEAAAAAYLIGETYKDLGELKKAKAAYANGIVKYPDQLVAVLSKTDQAEIAKTEGDSAKRIAILKELVFQTERKGQAKTHCDQASHALAEHLLYTGAFPEAKDALATTHKEYQLANHVVHFSRGPVSTLVQKPETKAQGEKMADQIVVFLRESAPTELAVEAKKGFAMQNWFWIAEIQHHAGRPEKVDETYDQMLKLFGNEDRILEAQGGWLRHRNKRDDARGVYSRMMNQIRGQQLIADTYREERKFDEAMNIYRDLAAKNAERASDWLAEVGHTLRQAGKLKDAINTYRTVDKFPSNLVWMAECHRDLKEHKESAALWGQVMADAGWAPRALLEIAYCYERQDQKENAIKTFQSVCRKFPRSGEASHAHAHLNNHYKITFTLGGAKDE